MRPAEKLLVLLLCRLGQEIRPLRPAELRRFSEALAAVHTDENAEVTDDVLRACGIAAEMRQRVLSLLARENVLTSYLAAAPDISVLTRISEGYPQRLRSLGAECPGVLFCKGDPRLLATRCVSLVGSRRLSAQGRAFARHIGTLAAKEGFTLVSGGAPGADRTAQEACLAAGGRVVSFVPDALTGCRARKNVLYCSDEGYELTFSAARALRRNLFIHALGEKVFVAQCPRCAGGTWAGTQENLRRGLSTVYALRDGTEGAEALGALGAVLLPGFPPAIGDLEPPQLSIFN